MNRKQRQANPPRAIRRRARRAKRMPLPQPVVVYEPAAGKVRARPRRGRKRPGNLLGTLANGAMSLLGKGIGSLITGFGDYKIEGNSLMTGGIDPPTVVNTVQNGGVIIRHREYLQDILASTPFNIITFPINPGQISTFPWLSSIAAHFEQYKFRGLLFEFKSLSSDAVLSTATSSALGSIVMATQYNALNPPFPNKFVMENYEFANSAKPSLSFIHPVECNRSDTSIVELYTRVGAPAAGSDLRLYDLGNFSIAAVGMQASSGVAGELWCTYEIEFIKPKISNPTNADEQVDHLHLAIGVTGINLLAGSVMDPSSTLNGTATGSTYTFPPSISSGRYMIGFVTVSTAMVTPSAGIRTYVNCQSVNLFLGGAQSRIATTGPNMAYLEWTCIDITAMNATYTVSLAAYPAPISTGDYFVIELPGNLTEMTKIQEVRPNVQEDEYGDDDLYQDDEQYFRSLIRDIITEANKLKL